jgi:hypothetical protein
MRHATLRTTLDTYGQLWRMPTNPLLRSQASSYVLIERELRAGRLSVFAGLGGIGDT